MGGLFSSSEKKNKNTTNNNNKNLKPASYSIFSKPPDFAIILGGNSAERFMGKYSVFDKNLDKDNFAQVFINKIVKDENLSLDDKIKELSYLSMVLDRVKQKNRSKNMIDGVKKALDIIKDNYQKYDKEVTEAIKTLQEEKKNKNKNKNKKPNNNPANSGNLKK